jgi:protein-S-isoprenylcysteine O-methyltransferase Ste14
MAIRIILFCGLIFHKTIWEIWKRKFPSQLAAKEKPGAAKRIVKLGKIAFLLFLMVQALFLNIFPMTPAPFFVRFMGLAIFIIGLATSVLARIYLGANWSDLEDRQVLPEQRLVTEGIYRYVRHPIYMGDVFLVTGFQLALNSWLFVIGLLLTAVVVRQAIREEKLLAGAFPEYKDYCLRTKRFVPFLI